MTKTLIAAAFAGGAVWIATVMTFPRGPYVDDRPYCSGFVTAPYTSGGVRVEPTFPPTCHGGPIPRDALAPSPWPAIATFLVIAGPVGIVRLFVLGATTPPSIRPGRGG